MIGSVPVGDYDLPRLAIRATSRKGHPGDVFG